MRIVHPVEIGIEYRDLSVVYNMINLRPEKKVAHPCGIRCNTATMLNLVLVFYFPLFPNICSKTSLQFTSVSAVDSYLTHINIGCR